MNDRVRINECSIFDNEIVEDDMNLIFERFTEKEKLENATILITGCAGFLGFYLTWFFLKNADRLKIKSVIGLDKFSQGVPEWIEELKARYTNVFQLHTFDIASDDLLSLKECPNADYILHMASIASPTFYRQFPVETIDANVWGLRALLDCYRERNIKGLLFFSSSEIYGDPIREAIPTSEEYPGRVMSMGPRACYDESKRFGETLCYTYADQYKMPITIVRPFNNFGPGLGTGDKRVPADFAQAVLNGEDITILSDGSPTRTFCYIADAIVGYLKALTYGRFDYFNIGMDQPEISIKDLAQLYVKHAKVIMDYRGIVQYGKSSEEEYLTDNPNRRCPNIEKAKKLLKFQPSISVDEGVRRYLKFLVLQRGKQ